MIACTTAPRPPPVYCKNRLQPSWVSKAVTQLYSTLQVQPQLLQQRQLARTRPSPLQESRLVALTQATIHLFNQTPQQASQPSNSTSWVSQRMIVSTTPPRTPLPFWIPPTHRLMASLVQMRSHFRRTQLTESSATRQLTSTRPSPSQATPLAVPIRATIHWYSHQHLPISRPRR